MWPSIRSNNKQDLNSVKPGVENQDNYSFMLEESVKEFGSDQMSNIISSSDPKPLTNETLDLPSQVTDPILQQGEDLLIPGFNNSSDSAETEDDLDKDLSATDDLAAPDANHSLGELRFAEDD